METKEINRDGTQCWRCKLHIFGILKPLTKLAGDFTAALCGDCINDWEVYIRDHEALSKCQNLEIGYHMLFRMTSGDGEDRTTQAQILFDEMKDACKVLFAIAETWTLDVIERPKPEPPPPPTPQEIEEMRLRRKRRLEFQLSIINGEIPKEDAQ